MMGMLCSTGVAQQWDIEDQAKLRSMRREWLETSTLGLDLFRRGLRSAGKWGASD